MAPALRAPARELEQTLRAGARTLAGSSRRMHSGFVVSEIALAVVLLVSAGMLGRTLVRLSSLDPGVNIHNVLTTRVALSPAALANRRRSARPGSDVLDRARRLPASAVRRAGRHRPHARRRKLSGLLGHAGPAAAQPRAPRAGIVCDPRLCRRSWAFRCAMADSLTNRIALDMTLW